MHPSNKITAENLNEIFSYHDQVWKIPYYAEVRKVARELAEVILRTCPDCADRTAALRKLRETVMTANASIALTQEEY